MTLFSPDDSLAKLTALKERCTPIQLTLSSATASFHSSATVKHVSKEEVVFSLPTGEARVHWTVEARGNFLDMSTLQGDESSYLEIHPSSGIRLLVTEKEAS